MPFPIKLTSIIAALASLLILPFFLKPHQNLLGKADDSLVVVSPHNEAVRYEFAHAFCEHYKKKTGRSIRVDWRLPGGTSEISRYLTGEYLAAFRYAWESSGRLWTLQVASAFDNPSIQPSDDMASDDSDEAVRRAFLHSNTGIGIDVFFGGGAYDFELQAAAGRLVPSDVLRRRPDWFGGNSIPRVVSGEKFYDERGLWFGASLSSFGFCYNTDSLRRLGVDKLPSSWGDLADPIFRREVALADPTKSGSAAKAFEMIIQQQMQECVSASGCASPSALAEGWARGLKIIQAASANARYFTDSAPRIPLDVSQGDAAIGMCIDFYGRFQSEAVRTLEGRSRLQYLTPIGGSSIGVDPVAILRGAPNRRAAEEFVEFVLSLEGQKIWNFKVGVPGGPVKYALRRLPIRKELYSTEMRALRSDPDVQPYEEARFFIYHPEWTSPVFRSMAFIIRVVFMDLHSELVSAWDAIACAGFPESAVREFADISGVDYESAFEKIRPALASKDRIAEVRLAKDLAEKFRERYLLARRIAEKGE